MVGLPLLESTEAYPELGKLIRPLSSCIRTDRRQVLPTPDSVESECKKSLYICDLVNTEE